MISIPISLKKDELFLNFFSNCNLSIRCYSLSVSVLSLSSAATISSIESGIVPRIVVLISPVSYTLLPVIYFFLLIAHTTIPMIISSIGTAIIMISPVTTACSVFIVILLKV